MKKVRGKTRDLMERILDALEATNPDYDVQGPNYGLLMDVASWLKDDKQVLTTELEVSAEADDIDGRDPEFWAAHEAMENLREREYPEGMVMVPELVDALEAWSRFEVAWYG